MTEFETMFQYILDNNTPERLAELAIDAGFPVDKMLTSENEAIRKVARRKLGFTVE